MSNTLTTDSLYGKPLFRFIEDGTDDISEEVLDVVRKLAAGGYTMREMGLLAQMARAGDKGARKLSAGNISVGDRIRVTNISPKYLAGAEGVVIYTDPKDGYVEVRLETETGKKFTAGGTVGLRVGSYEVID